VILIVFVGAISLPEAIGIVSACQKILNDFKTDIFEVNVLIVIIFLSFPTSKVLAFGSTWRGTKFEY